MSCVHYKFKSAVNFETVTFDGMQISVADLKKAIIQQKKMGKLMENFDLQLTKPQSTEVYKDVDLIPKNSSIIVARIPVERAKTRSWEPTRVDMSTAHSAQKTAEAHERQRKAADLVNMQGSEEDKVKMMIQQSGKEYSQTNYMKPRYPTGPPPRNYVCHRCGQPGHFINSCPNRDDGEMMPRMKRSTGIPNSFMTPVLDPHAPGVLLTNSGQLAVPTIDAMAYKQGKKEKPPFVKSDSPDRKQEEKIIPGELLCPVCKDLLTDAVVAPCCGNSSCDECIRDSLLDSDDHVCPLCKETGISPDALIPNKFMRTAVNNFQNETGYTTVKRRNSLQEEAPVAAPPPKAAPRQQPAPRLEPERQPALIPAHLVGMPPQVIKAAQAEMASKEAHTHPDGKISGGAQSAVEAYPSAQVVSPGYVLQSQQLSNAVASMAGYSAPYSVAHYQQPVIAHSVGMTMSHAVASLVHSSQVNQGGHRPPVSTVYIDQHGVHHAMPMRHRVAHPGRPWLGPVTRGVLVQGRGLQRTMILRPSSVGARRLGPPPSSGEHRFAPPTQPDHRFQPPPSQVAGPISPNQIPGHAMAQGPPPGRAPSQQAPPGMTAPPVASVVRMSNQLHSGGPPPQMVFNRGPAGQVPRMMGPDMLMGPPPGFIPPLIPPTGANMPPPVPLTEEEFYREKERLLELERKKKSQESTESSSTVSRKRADPMDDFEELLQKKNRSKAAAPPYRSPRSRSPRSRSRSFTKSRSRTRSRSMKKRSRSLSRSRSRSPIKSPLRRSRSMTRSLSRSRSRAFPRSKSRTRSPYAPRKKSFTPPRKYSRSRSPLPKRPRSRSFTRSPRPRSRTRSRSLPRRKATRSPMRSMTRSPLPKKRLARSRSPASRGRSPLPPKRGQPKSPSPRGKSRDRSRGPSQARPRPPDMGAARFTPPDRPRGGVYSSPLRYDNRGAYYRYQEKYDPRWTEYYRMWQDWYDKYGTFAQGFPASYDHPGRTHSRPMPRSRSHSPRPPKRSRSPGDSTRWRREKSPKRPRLDMKEKERPVRGKGERDEFRRSPVDKAKERRKDVRGIPRPEKDHRAATDFERMSRAPLKSERRRDDDRRDDPKQRSPERIESQGKNRDRVDVRGRSPERHDGRGKSRDRDDIRGRSRERDDVRGRSRERDDVRGRSRERDVIEARGRSRERDANRDQHRSKADTRENETDRTIDLPRGAIDSTRPVIDSPRGAIDSSRGSTVKTLWDKDNAEHQEEASSIPVIGAGTGVSRPATVTRGLFHGNERDPVREREKEELKHEVKEEVALSREPERRKPEDPVREPARIKQERPPEEPVWASTKDDHSRESVDRSNKERQPVKAEILDTVDLKPDQPRREKLVLKEPAPDLTGSPAFRAASLTKDSSSGSDRSSPRSRTAALDLAPPTKEVKAGKLALKEKPVPIEGADGGRSKRSDRQPTTKKKTSPSMEDILIANVPGASKWESNLSDSDPDIPPPRQKGKERDRSTNLPRSVLESADNAIRQKPRPSVVVSSVCSPPPRSSIHRISTDSRPSPPPPQKPEPEKKQDKRHEAILSHSRKVIQGATSRSMKVTLPGAKELAKVTEKSELRKEESRKDPSRRGEGDSQRSTEKVRSVSSSARREEDVRPSKKVDKGQSSSSKFKDEVSRRGAGVRDRKASVFMDEDKFEPDYNESGSSDYEESRATVPATQAERSRRHESSSESEEVKAAKQKKRHKKQKKHKKHKSKSHKDEK